MTESEITRITNMASRNRASADEARDALRQCFSTAAHVAKEAATQARPEAGGCVGDVQGLMKRAQELQSMIDHHVKMAEALEYLI